MAAKRTPSSRRGPGAGADTPASEPAPSTERPAPAAEGEAVASDSTSGLERSPLPAGDLALATAPATGLERLPRPAEDLALAVGLTSGLERSPLPTEDLALATGPASELERAAGPSADEAQALARAVADAVIEAFADGAFADGPRGDEEAEPAASEPRDTRAAASEPRDTRAAASEPPDTSAAAPVSAAPAPGPGGATPWTPPASGAALVCAAFTEQLALFDAAVREAQRFARLQIEHAQHHLDEAARLAHGTLGWVSGLQADLAQATVRAARALLAPQRRPGA